MNSDAPFRTGALERLAAAEELDERLQVTPPRAWLALAALACVVAGAAAWSWFGRVPITVTGEGAFVSERELIVFVGVPDGRRVRPAMTTLVTPAADSVAAVASQSGTVQAVGAQPASRAELLAVLGDESLLPRGPRLAVTIALPAAHEARGTPGTARIVVATRRPAALLLGR